MILLGSQQKILPLDGPPIPAWIKWMGGCTVGFIIKLENDATKRVVRNHCK